MKTLRKLILATVICFSIGYASGTVYAQECFAWSTQGSCVGGECICYSIQTSCTDGSACSAGGGACSAKDGVSVSWEMPVTCNF